MNPVVLLIVTLVFGLTVNLLRKVLSNRYEHGMRALLFHSAVVSLTMAIAMLVTASSLSCSLFTLWFGVLFGVVNTTQQVTNLKALELGPLSYTSVLISLSSLIPTLSGSLFWGETLSVAQIIGIVLMIGCLLLSVNTEKEQKKASLKWLLYCAISFLTCGGIGLMQKIYQTSAQKDESDMFLLVAFAASFVLSVAGFALKSLRAPRAITPPQGTRSIYAVVPVLLMVLIGITYSVNHKLNLFLSGAMDSALFFPVVNGVGLILVLLSSLILFREKLSLKQWIGVLLGIAAVVLLCDPF